MAGVWGGAVTAFHDKFEGGMFSCKFILKCERCIALFWIAYTDSYKLVLTSRKQKVSYTFDVARMGNWSFFCPSVDNNYNERNPPLI